MARDYKAEYQKAKENGWYNGVKKINVGLSGHYVEGYNQLLEDMGCKTLGEFIRLIIDGQISVTKRF